MPIRSTFFVAAAGAIVAVPSFAAGSVITYDMLTEGETAVTLDLPEATVDATAQGGTFQFKSQGGYDAVGISGGSSPGEIEGAPAWPRTSHRPLRRKAPSGPSPAMTSSAGPSPASCFPQAIPAMTADMATSRFTAWSFPLPAPWPCSPARW